MLDNLNKKLKAALRSRSKSVSFTPEEITELVADLNRLLLENNQLSKKVIQLLEDNNSSSIDIISTGF